MEGVAADLERFAFVQPAGRLERGGNGKTVLGGRFGQGLQQEFVVCMRADDGDGAVFPQFHHAAGMVEVSVGQPNGGQGEVFSRPALAAGRERRRRHLSGRLRGFRHPTKGCSFGGRGVTAMISA